MLVYHGLRKDYPYASARLHRFILEASRDFAAGCRERGLACIQYVDRSAKRERSLVYRLAAHAAVVVLEDQPAFVVQHTEGKMGSAKADPCWSHAAAATKACASRMTSVAMRFWTRVR